MDSAQLEAIAKAIRFDILRMTHRVGSGHPTSSFSAVELATVLFFKYFRFDLDNPESWANDRLIFSKGHASALFYSLYHLAGKVSEKELLTYRDFQSTLEGHPTRRFAYADAATGSLGQGLSIGAGIAWALRARVTSPADLDGSVASQRRMVRSASFDAGGEMPFLLPRVYVLLGDGELAEGAVWEAAAWASYRKLRNLVAVVDANRFGQSGETMYGQNTNAYRDRFESFGWGTIVIDGHDFAQIDAAFEKALVYRGGPVAIIARTLKGKGIALWEDKDGWHNKMLPKADYERACSEFGGKGVAIPVEVKKPEGHVATGVESVFGRLVRSLTFPKVNAYDPGKPVATKQGFGNALVRVAAVEKRLIVLDGDVANSLATEAFRQAYPERFLEMYIAEQNMAGVATGLSRMNLIPVIATFSAFLTRAHDQFRMMPLSHTNVIVDGSYAGASVGRDGPSQMGFEDLSMFSAIHGSTVLYPADAYAAERLFEEATGINGVVYIRTTREPTPVIYTSHDEFPVGGSKTWPVSRLAKGQKLKESAVVVAAGITLHEALAAQEELCSEGIGIRVIDCYSVKPIDTKSLQKAVSGIKRLVVVEDHFPEGGLGSAVLAATAGIGPYAYRHLAVRKLPTSGTKGELFEDLGLSKKAIIRAIRTVLAK